MICLNPFGSNDEDFEMDYLIERNNLFAQVYMDDIFDSAPLIKNFRVTKLPQSIDVRRIRSPR